jgi:hypothetical protein
MHWWTALTVGPNPRERARSAQKPGAVRKLIFLFVAPLVLSLAGCSSLSTPPPTSALPALTGASHPPVIETKRVIYYYQTQYSDGRYVSLSPILHTLDPNTGKPFVTDVLVAAFHLGFDSNNAPYIHLNDNPPGDPMFDVMWPQVAKLQSSGITARMMLGGGAAGSYAVLFSQWHTFYPILKQTLQQYKLNGIDLDVEERVSLPDIEKLIDRLHRDFGNGFIITLAPVASALFGGANLSGFDYQQLYDSPSGARIAWFNGQFYSGFGTLASTVTYDRIVTFGYPPDKVVAGMIANPADGSGFVAIDTVRKTVEQLVAKYPTFGGVFAWEYFNALPGGPTKPAKWSAVMGKAMGL